MPLDAAPAALTRPNCPALALPSPRDCPRDATMASPPPRPLAHGSVIARACSHTASYPPTHWHERKKHDLSVDAHAHAHQRAHAHTRGLSRMPRRRRHTEGNRSPHVIRRAM